MTPSVTARVLVPIILIEFCQKALKSHVTAYFVNKYGQPQLGFSGCQIQKLITVQYGYHKSARKPGRLFELDCKPLQSCACATQRQA